MSIHGALDAIAVKAETIPGLKRCYSATGSGVSSTLRPIPRGIDDGPVGVVWLGTWDMTTGNIEHVVVNARLDIWVRADDPGYAYRTIVGFIDSIRNIFRQDMDLGGQATRCGIAGGDEIESETVGDRTFLILPVRLDLLVTRYASDATA